MTDKKTPDTAALQVHTTPDQLLALAVDKDLDIEKLTKLMDLKKQWDTDQARKAFFEAFTGFQSACPEIRKTREADFGPGKTKYKYAALADITRQIKDVVKQFGFSFRWEISDNGDKIEVTCLLTHSDGHTERTRMSANADTSGSKNPIQAKGSAIEYMKRYTLIGALGISTADTDNDGNLPDIDIDILHKQYMEHYNFLVEIDPKLSKWHPDNWRTEPTAKVYVRAISEIRKKLAELTPKEQ